MFPAVCASCGVETEVPFQPSGEKPVYCRDCFQSMRRY
jgi:CxxC-x17-CxxC domain-containing protein